MHSFSWTDLEEKIPWILNDKMYCLHSGGNFVFFAFNLKAFKWYDCKRKTTNNNQCILFSVLFNFPSFKRIQFCYSHKMIWTNGSKKNRVQFFINFNFFSYLCSLRVIWCKQSVNETRSSFSLFLSLDSNFKMHTGYTECMPPPLSRHTHTQTVAQTEIN